MAIAERANTNMSPNIIFIDIQLLSRRKQLVLPLANLYGT